MLRSIKSFEEHPLRAADGLIGSIKDFLFDDLEWTVRYLVLDTGTWLSERKVLVSSTTLKRAEGEPTAFALPVTRDAIENSPPLYEGKPISREYEAVLARYHGWPAYWESLKLAAATAVNRRSEVLPDTVKGMRLEEEGRHNLRSANEVMGYRVFANDGDVGKVEDFVIEDEAWIIRYLVVDTGNWLRGRKVLVAPQWARRLSWTETKVEVDLSKEAIESSPEYNPFSPVNREYEMQLYDFYGRPSYWSSADKK